MQLTPAGEQIEEAMAQGYPVAAFNLYVDAISHDVELAEVEDESDSEEHTVAEWHRDIQRRTGFHEAKVQDGLILRKETYPRDESGIVIEGESTFEYLPNEDL